jgi:hypothetical protein
MGRTFFSKLRYEGSAGFRGIKIESYLSYLFSIAKWTSGSLSPKFDCVEKPAVDEIASDHQGTM